MTDRYEGAVVLTDDPTLGPEVQIDFPGYSSTPWRAMEVSLLTRRQELHSLGGAVFAEGVLEALENDSTRQHRGEPLGERIVMQGPIVDKDGRAMPRAPVQVWQASAGGRDRHQVDDHPAPPLHPNFSGASRLRGDRSFGRPRRSPCRLDEGDCGGEALQADHQPRRLQRLLLTAG